MVAIMWALLIASSVVTTVCPAMPTVIAMCIRTICIATTTRTTAIMGMHRTKKRSMHQWLPW